MKWGWHIIHANNWRYNDRWGVSRHWATEKWSVLRDGEHLPSEYETPQAAIEEAEKLMEE